jgi:hypothetical protein
MMIVQYDNDALKKVEHSFLNLLPIGINTLSRWRVKHKTTMEFNLTVATGRVFPP